ncbi:helix-turn-helix domain-containing protein [Streptomyces sp. NPDC056269]|uniref:helix-turn-helix domain-containing protein n=1 Tax=Streptomyces sp. NPDC056269 TaxID=3345768 RepID=UPI0035D9A642
MAERTRAWDVNTAGYPPASGSNESVLADSKHIDTLVTAFRQAVEEDFIRTRTVSDYARRLGTSRWHLDAAVRQATGLTPKGHVDARVIHEAKHLLVHSTLTATAVGTRLGFTDRATFGRFFRTARESPRPPSGPPRPHMKPPRAARPRPRGRADRHRADLGCRQSVTPTSGVRRG